jgi:DNA-binding PadR family transcriptional regulator
MSDAELAVLSIIAEGPIYGYDLQTEIAQRGLRAWTQIGVSSMYYVLEKLARQGLIEASGTPGADDIARRQYRITAAGSGVLQTAVADLISTPREHADEFELGLANLHVLRPDQIRTAFTAYRQELTSLLAQAREHQQALDDGDAPFQIAAMLGHRAAMLAAELAWMSQFVEAWEAQAPPDEPPPASPEPADIPRMKQRVLPQDPDSPHRRATRRAWRTPPSTQTEASAEAPTSQQDAAPDEPS